MKKQRFRVLLTAATLFMTAAFSSTAFADTKIPEVKISVNVKDGSRLEAGDPIDDSMIDVVSREGEKYDVTGFTFMNSGDTWRRGNIPIILVDLEADGDYYFSSSSKSYFDLYGDMSPSYEDAEKFDKYSMELTIKLRSISSGTNAPGFNDVWWDDYEACWEEDPDAREYEVRLYRDGSHVTTKETDDTEYDFTSNMTRRGDYSFRVRPRYSSHSYGGWSDFSEDIYISSDDAEDNRDSDSSSGGPGGGSSSHSGGGPGVSGSNSGGPGSNSGSTLPSSGWVQNSIGWWYRFSNGTNPAASWQNINHKWYYFANTGYMHVGWLNLNNNWYYLRLSNGDMIQGWYPINNQWYYFNENGTMHTGWLQLNNIWYYLQPNGAMVTGWNYINGKWYYMDGSGAMYANRQTPDGHYVDASGAMIR